MKYKRVLLKLSGEALAGKEKSGIDFDFVYQLAGEIKKLVKLKVEVAIVIGAGNYWRYRNFKHIKLDRVNSDYLGMIATIINSIVLQDILRTLKVDAFTMSALPVSNLAERYDAERGRDFLAKKGVLICAGGTGNPFCTTDFAGILRAGELNCDVVMKATNVDFVYDKDPHKFKDAKPIKNASYSEVLQKELEVMDLSAIATAREAKVPIVIFNLHNPKNLLDIIKGKNIGTLIK